jgi:hypothetical protein
MATEGKSKSPRTLILVGVLVLVAVVVAWQFLGSRPPAIPADDEAGDLMKRVVARLSGFVASEQRIPESLDELNAGGVEKTPTKDPWGHAMAYSQSEKGPLDAEIVLRCLGKDGQPETDDDYVSVMKFGNDGYGKLGVTSTDERRGK